MARKKGTCIECGELKEIAAYGLCFTCYRRQQREEAKKGMPLTPENKRKEAIKQEQNYSKIRQGLLGLGVKDEHALTIRAIVSRYLYLLPEFNEEIPGEETVEEDEE